MSTVRDAPDGFWETCSRYGAALERIIAKLPHEMELKPIMSDIDKAIINDETMLYPGVSQAFGELSRMILWSSHQPARLSKALEDTIEAKASQLADLTISGWIKHCSK